MRKPAFIFSTSHLPETRVRRPDHLEEEEDEEVMQQPMPRAFSHLPQPVHAQADSSGPLSKQPAMGRPPRIPVLPPSHAGF